MSEIAEDRDYYAAAEAAFIRRRGTPFLLSPTDFALLKQWRALGVPLAAVEAGIDEAFTRREERSAVGKVNSLSYCRDAVLEAWERHAEAARGKGGPGSGAGAEPDEAATRSALESLTRRLEEAANARRDLEAPLAAAVRSLDRLSRSGKRPEEIEASLARLDRRLAGGLYAAFPEPERAALDRQIDGLLQGAGAGERMDPATAEKTRKALARRTVRERLGLPRLSLL
ncbi:MAG TPA: hypothetical protein VGK26_11825 [Thermoanaerobaculia bacterium]|jgi:hypothetical protein